MSFFKKKNKIIITATFWYSYIAYMAYMYYIILLYYIQFIYKGSFI